MSQNKPTILWDFEGTLVSMPGQHRSALIDVLNSYEPGHHITQEQIIPYLQTSYPWHKPEESHLHWSTPELWWLNLEIVFTKAYKGVGFDARRSQELAKQVRRYLVDPHRYTIYEDTLPAMRILQKQGWRQGVLSNHIPELPAIVKGLGLSKYLDFCITSANIGYEKPNPEAFRIALDRAGNPEKVWMLGDNILADIKGAEALGIRAILVRAPKNTDIKYYASNLIEAVKIITDII